jgi:nucleoid-associated protein YgaU
LADLDALMHKYAPVIDKINQFAPYGAKVISTDLDGEKLHLKAEVPSKVVANRVWDAIKTVDPEYADLEHEMATTGPDEQPYTIQSGDTLGAIAVLFYGHANKYPEIASANGIDNPDHISVGATLQLPVLS